MRRYFLVIMTMLLSVYSCEFFVDHGYFIKVQNKANVTIWCYASYNYPDISLAVNKPLLQMIKPQVYTKLESKEDWKKVLPKDTIVIFILSKDTVDKYTWDRIRDEYNILKRYDLSIEDLEEQNWVVAYP
jgi:hypothetical protein